jgi:hypothetical protein
MSDFLQELSKATPVLLDAARAAVKYDDAIRSCGNDPQKMSSFCTAQGEDLDKLYFEWMTLARKGVALAEGDL